MKKTAALALAAGLSISGASMLAFEQPVFAQTGNSTIDMSKQGSLTLHKRANPTRLDDAAGVENTGVTGQALNGVEFTLSKVKSANLSTNAGLLAASKLTPAEIEASNLEEIGARTTADQGTAKFENLAVGVYLVEETKTPEGYTPAAPFLVFIPMTAGNAGAGGTTWQYDVVAYPKNYNSTKPTKKVEDSGQNVGQSVTYTIDTTARTFAASQKRTVYRIKDTLDASLDAENATVVVDGYAEGTDYTVHRDGQTIQVIFNETGLGKIQNGTKVSVKITAKVVKMPAGGKLPNQAIHIQNDPTTSQGATPDPGGPTPPTGPGGPPPEIPTEEVNTYFSGIQFTKVGEDRKGLEGAEFQVYGTNADTCSANIQNETDALQSVGGQRTFISGDNGLVTISGLHVNDYTDSAVKVNKWKNYCLVETKSPTGFELLSTPILFNLTKDNAGKTLPITVGDNTGEVVNIKDTTPRLPQTGGAGVFLLIALGIVIAGGGIYAARRNSAA
ncbi:SpaH/EbpB family LPXTG-anchored major pilin [Corynebacterium mayonis]|uniref:SpaH/EbpB family LPXTG-anchored major pilin n=1 Tax=Corynebacterium mayonis TaxID=3062461 RepID=UPI0031403138